MSEPSKEAAENVRTRILRTRAQALAKPHGNAAAAGSILEVLEFNLGRERFAIETSAIMEVRPLKEMTPIPCAPSYLLGLVSLRSRILPVFALSSILKSETPAAQESNPWILFFEREDLCFGFLIDGIAGVRPVEVKSIQKPQIDDRHRSSSFVKGLTEDGLLILDAETILKNPLKILGQDLGAEELQRQNL